MTTIAWDGETFAADKRTSFGSRIATTIKIHRVGAMLVGGSGGTAEIQEMVQWIKDGRNPDKFPAAQRDGATCTSMLVIQPDEPIWHYENSPYPLHIYNKQWAIGSGCNYAIAAMHLGKTAREAVEIACLFDSNSGNGVDELTLHE